MLSANATPTRRLHFLSFLSYIILPQSSLPQLSSNSSSSYFSLIFHPQIRILPSPPFSSPVHPQQSTPSFFVLPSSSHTKLTTDPTTCFSFPALNPSLNNLQLPNAGEISARFRRVPPDPLEPSPFGFAADSPASIASARFITSNPIPFFGKSDSLPALLPIPCIIFFSFLFSGLVSIGFTALLSSCHFT